MENTARPTTPPAPSNSSPTSPRTHAVIDHLGHPHIINDILSFGGLATHRAFAGASRAYLERADALGECRTYSVDVVRDTCTETRQLGPGVVNIPRKRVTKVLRRNVKERGKAYWWPALRKRQRLTRIQFVPVADYFSDGDLTKAPWWDSDEQEDEIPSRPVCATDPWASQDVGVDVEGEGENVNQDGERGEDEGFEDDEYEEYDDSDESDSDESDSDESDSDESDSDESDSDDSDENEGNKHHSAAPACQTKIVFFINDHAAWTSATRHVPYYKDIPFRVRGSKKVFVIEHSPLRFEYALAGWTSPEPAERPNNLVFIFPKAVTEDNVFTCESQPDEDSIDHGQRRHHEMILAKNFAYTVHFHKGARSIKNCTLTFVNLPEPHHEAVRALLTHFYRHNVQCPSQWFGHACEPIPAGVAVRQCLLCGKEHRFVDGKFKYGCSGCSQWYEKEWARPRCTDSSCYPAYFGPDVQGPWCLQSYEFDAFLSENVKFITAEEYRTTLKPGEWEEETVRLPEDDGLAEAASRLAIEEWRRGL